MIALTFTDALFPSNRNVRLWLQSQGAKHEIDQLSVRGEYTISHAGRCALVVLKADLRCGDALPFRRLQDPGIEEVELDQGVKGYRYRTQEGTNGEADTEERAGD